MNRKITLAMLLMAAAFAGCSGNDDDPVTVDSGVTYVTTTTTWSGTVTLTKHVFVKDATLTIEPGTTVLGHRGSSIVVTATGKIHAVGTAEAPIVFTSAQPEGYRAAGDWGGVVLLGRAPINVKPSGTNKIEGFPSDTEDTEYGGIVATHDCGAIKYARIEFAGYQLAPDNELNGLTIGGCGSQTQLDYIQVHKGADDGIEFFGGTTDLKHALVTQPDDDGLDWDYGWTGRVQFVVVQQNSSVGDKGIEADNNGSDHAALPRSKPTIYNISLIGSNSEPGTAGKNQGGIHFRRGTAGEVYNAIVMGFTDKVIDVDGSASVAQFVGGELFLKNSFIYDNANITDTTTTWPESNNDGGFDEAAEFFVAALGNDAVDPQLEDPYNLADPSFLPTTGSAALSGGGTPPADGFFDTAATFIGAFGTEDWTSGWTAFPAN